jgi:uncharacterized membrane protein HdeD (DUF308 family)
MAKNSKSNMQEFGSAVSSLLILRGVVAVLFGIFAVVWPGLTLGTLSILLALWFIISGVAGIITSVMSREGNWVLSMLVAILEVCVGTYLVQRPQITIALLVGLVAIVFVTRGVVDIVSSIIDSNEENRWINALLGLIGLIAGVVIWRYPETSTLAFVWVLGLYAIIAGTFMIIGGAQVHKALKSE